MAPSSGKYLLTDYCFRVSSPSISLWSRTHTHKTFDCTCTPKDDVLASFLLASLSRVSLCPKLFVSYCFLFSPHFPFPMRLCSTITHYLLSKRGSIVRCVIRWWMGLEFHYSKRVYLPANPNTVWRTPAGGVNDRRWVGVVGVEWSYLHVLQFRTASCIIPPPAAEPV